MKIKKVITKTEECILEIEEAILLSVEEAETLPLRLRSYDDGWWPRSPSYSQGYAAYVCGGDGFVCEFGGSVDFVHYAVRPALVLKNLEASDFKIGDKFLFKNIEFEIISDNLAFCLSDIGTHPFREDHKAEDANIYEASDIKKYIDAWFFEETKRQNKVAKAILEMGKKEEQRNTAENQKRLEISVKMIDKETNQVLSDWTVPLLDQSKIEAAVVKEIDRMKADNTKRKELIDKLNKEMEEILEKIKAEETKKYESAEEEYEDEYNHYLKMALNDIKDCVDGKKEKCHIDTYKIAEDAIKLQISQAPIGDKCPICKNSVKGMHYCSQCGQRILWEN